MLRTTIAARESRIRRALRADGLALWKPRGRHAVDCGPYAIRDPFTGTITSWGYSLDEIERHVARDA